MGCFTWENTVLTYEEDSGIILLELSGVPKSGDIREYSAKILEWLRQKPVVGIITDTTSVSGSLPDEDQKWLIEEWGPKAEAAGLEHQALVLSERAVELFSIDELPESGYGRTTVKQRMFSDISEAREWLLSQ